MSFWDEDCPSRGPGLTHAHWSRCADNHDPVHLSDQCCHCAARESSLRRCSDCGEFRRCFTTDVGDTAMCFVCTARFVQSPVPSPQPPRRYTPPPTMSTEDLRTLVLGPPDPPAPPQPRYLPTRWPGHFFP